MALIASGYVVTETTLAGTTAGLSSGAPTGVGLKVDKIVAWGQSSVATNTSGGLKFRRGQSSGGTLTTMVILPVPSSNGMVVELNNLNIYTGFFDFATEEAGDWAVWVFSK